MKWVPVFLPLIAGFAGLILAASAGWRLLRQLRGLQGARKVLARNVMISTFSAGISISFSALMYFIWSGSKGQLMLVLASLGFATFLASVASAVRTTLRWNELPRDGTRPV
jgi:hypothetical protein